MGVLALMTLGGVTGAQEGPDLTTLSVDDLMNVEVTSVSRKGQKLADTAAAVFVITQDDIRRSGATSIPEILRIVPGLDVARINGNVWAVSARGFNGKFANKLLVMIDGRIVYTPLFSGVFWDVQDTLLEDIDRIEVIRGPGGTLWGANAVNGIINIITKHAIETQGTLLSAGGGAVNGASGSGRYGGSIGHRGYYRIYGKSFDRPTSIGGANPSHDGWTMARAGFRADWTSRRGDNFSAQGDIYQGSAEVIGVLIDPDRPFASRDALTRLAGHDLQFLWTAVQSSRSDTTLQAVYDYTARSDPNLVMERSTFEFDFHQHLKAGRRNDIVWGVGYRRSDGQAEGPGLKLVRDSTVAGIASAFVQDEITVAPRVHLTLGTKLQYDDVSDLQLQPTARLLIKAGKRQTIWASATSALHTLSEIELYGQMTVGTFPDGTARGGLIVISGNSELKPERVEAYEAGYRWQIAPGAAFDATVFHNRLRDLAGSRVGAPMIDGTGRTILPVTIRTTSRGETNGAEFLLTGAVTPTWDLALGYSLFRLAVTDDGGLPEPEAARVTTPRHQLQLRSSAQLPRHLSVDSSLYYVGPIGDEVPAYLRLDAQLSWRPGRRWDLSISGQNLLQSRHTEFSGSVYERQLATPVQRTVNGKVTWRF